MFAVLDAERIQWPGMTESEMTDLMAYLQAEPARDPTPDLLQGQIVLVRKGCLKCHRLRNEGGRVGMELTRYQGRYESP